MVIYIQELKINSESGKAGGKFIQADIINLSVNLLDQGQWVDEILNPLLLVPGMKTEYL